MNKLFLMMFGGNGSGSAPILSTTVFNPPDGIIGTVYNYDCSVCFVGTGISYSLVGFLPNGLSLNTSNGVISGTPMLDYTFPYIQIMATNTVGSITTVYADILISQPSGSPIAVNDSYNINDTSPYIDNVLINDTVNP